MQLNTLHDLLLAELNDLYDAERRISAALPKLERAATNADLKQAFSDHLEETQGHVRRLDEAFSKLGAAYNGETCEATQGLIKEGEEIIEAMGQPAVRDAALIGAAQRVEHYEMAGYGTARTLAEQLHLDDIASLLQETLDEEAKTDHKLTKIATGGLFGRGVNKEAAQVS
jgi:ferritin-like metal-binding protein YciE